MKSILSLVLLSFTAALYAVEPFPAKTAVESVPIPFSELGSKATADYKGDAIGITATAGGAILRTGFQKLVGTVTREGLSLESTAEGGGTLKLSASAIGRAEGQTSPIPQRGSVVFTDKLVTFTRPGLVEEYSVSADGVRQDFIVMQRPAGSGGVNVELALSGATAEAASEGVKLTLDRSGRVLAYNRLRVTDATGRALAATLEVLSPARLAVRVEDAGAVYPVRIDPTFSDADWVSLSSGLIGTSNAVNALLADASGNLYVGGSFVVAGTVVANRIAKWDGSVWTTLGSGMDGAVNSLALNGTDLYAGGSFLTAGGVTVNRIAKWNGTAWSALSTGMNGSTVNALAVSGTDLYAGGDFTTAGGVTVNRIAKWDGTAWSALSTGMASGSVNALAVSGSNLYAGGSFLVAAGVTVNSIAKWDGTAWSALSTGMSNPNVRALAVNGTDLYVGGLMVSAGGVTAYAIAKWNGTAWSALSQGPTSTVNALAFVGTNLYAGGGFTSADGLTVNRIAKWSGTAWSALGASTGTNGTVSAVALMGTDLYVGGDFTLISSVPARGIAKWNGSAWSALGSGVSSNSVWALAVMGSDLYASGTFPSIGGVSGTGGVAKWNGTSWSKLGTAGTAIHGLTMAVRGTDLYVAGSFSTVGVVTAERIAKWDGSTWSALGTGFAGQPSSMAVLGSDLYVGGALTQAGGVTVTGIAKWNGSIWSAVGGALNSPYVNALAVKGTDLYVGGSFTSIGALTANYVAKWDGTAWSALGTGLGSSVNALAVSGSDIYAGGDFTTAGGAAANRIAKWSGTAWSALGSGMDGSVKALVVDGSSHLYAGGSFGTAGSTLSPSIVRANLPLNPPSVTSLDIASGSTAGGTSVTITGTGFTGATTVTIGGVAAASFSVGNDTTITAVMPAGTAGSASVVVTTPGGSNAANTLYSYSTPLYTNHFTGNSGGLPAGWTDMGLDTAGTSTIVESGTVVTITDTRSNGGPKLMKTASLGPLAAFTAYVDISSMTSPTIGGVPQALVAVGQFGSAYVFIVNFDAVTKTFKASAIGGTSGSLTLAGGPHLPSYAGGALSYVVQADTDSFRVTSTTDSYDSGEILFSAIGASGFDSIDDLGTAPTLLLGAESGGSVTDALASVAFDRVVLDGTAAVTVTAILPPNGTTAGGSSVTIIGTGFTGATGVTIGGVAATGVTVISDTMLTATTGAHASGATNVAVTAPGGTATGTGMYTFGTAPVAAGGTWGEQTGTGSITCYSITSSADGLKLAAAANNGSIWTSTNGGVTWTERTGAGTRIWYGITSSSDGLKLAAVAFGSAVVTSSDGGANWTVRTASGTGLWHCITSSADGSRLAAVQYGGNIKTSTDSGATWTSSATGSGLNWVGIASSADGMKLVAVAKSAVVWTSTDGGVNWTQNAGSSALQYQTCASSADGTKLAAAVYGGYIYTSADSGVTWTERSPPGNASWTGITSSADGNLLAAVADGTSVWTTSDAGSNWVERTSSDSRSWTSITTSADGSRLAAGVGGGYIYTSQGAAAPTVTSLDITSGSTAGGNSVTITGTGFTGATTVTIGGVAAASFSVVNDTTITAVMPAGTAGSASVVVTTPGGSNAANALFTYNAPPTLAAIIKSGFEDTTVTFAAADFTGAYSDPESTALASITVASLPITGALKLSGVDVTASQVIAAANLANLTYVPAVNENGDKTFGVTASDGTSSSAPATTVTMTLTPVNDAPSFALPAGVTTPAGAIWTARDSDRSWTSIASSADGTKLAAVTNGGMIYTSTDSGAIWTARESDRNWKSIASSADGSKLAAVVNGGQIYTSTDSGASWTARDSSRDWQSITSSADGSKLAAVHLGFIYTSTNSGISWTQQSAPNTYWVCITSSADGSKLAAVDWGSAIYTSSDSGVTWTLRGGGNWWAITSSADGSKLAATQTNGQIYTSTDSGASWTAQASGSFNWKAITSSADGSKLAAVADSSQIYTSADSGVTWVARESDRTWSSIASSADGGMLAAVDGAGRIYTSAGGSAPHNISVAGGSGVSTTAGFASSISAGPATEAGQTVSFAVSADNTGLFTTQPAIAGNGTLTFTIGSTAGSAIVTVVAQDDGGTANGGTDTSASQTFTITVTLPVPTVTSLDVTSGSTAGSTNVTITGTGFTGVTGVTFGGVAAASFTFVNDTTITATTAAGSAGSASVVVTTAGGSNAGNALYTYAVPDYIITTTGNAIVVTDSTGNADTLTLSEPSAGNIQFAAAGRNFTVNNGGIISGDSGTLSRTSVTSISVDAAAGADTINVGAFTGTLPNLTLNGGTGNDTVNLNGSLTFASNASLDLDLQNDNASPGIDSVNVSASAVVAASGTGTVTVRVSQSLALSTGGQLKTVNGALTIEANIAGTNTNTFDGVTVDGGSIQTTGTGILTVVGKGGSGGGTAPSGVVLLHAGTIIGGTSGTVSVTGTGGTGSSTNSGPLGLAGVKVMNGSSTITSSGANVQVTGFGGTATGDSAWGILVYNNGTITAGGTGSVTVAGTGGSCSGGFNIGVLLSSNNTFITSANGPVQVTGIGGVGGDSNHGVMSKLNGKITAGGTNAVTVTGTGGSGTGGGHTGVLVTDSGSQITSGGGNITVTGTPGTGGTAANGVQFISSGALTTATNGGNITVIADTMGLSGPVSGNSSSTVALRQKTNGVAFDLGSGVNTTPSTVELSDAELDNVTAGTVAIGDANSGTITTSAAITHPNNLSLITGAGLTVSQSLTMPVNKNLTVNGVGTLAVNAAIAATGTGAISMTTARDIVVTSAAISTVNGALSLSANAAGTNTAAFTGVSVNTNSSVSVTGSGNLTVVGKGGSGGGTAPSGVEVVDTSSISGGTSGTVSVMGTGGTGSSVNTGSGSMGGVKVWNSSSITSNGANVQVTGVGGTGTTSAVWGILLYVGGSNISAGGTGSVTVHGTGGSSSGGFNNGVDINTQNGRISANNGPVQVTGIGGVGGAGNHGVNFRNTSDMYTVGANALTITGTGGSGTGGGHGGILVGASTNEIKTGGGNIIITGTPGTGGSGNLGVYANGTLTTATNGGNITVIADSMNLATGTVSTNSSGTVTLRQKTNAVAINLGSAVDTTASTLELSDAELDTVTAGTLVIGDANSGLTTISDVISPVGYPTLDIQKALTFAATGGFSADLTSATVFEKLKANGAVIITAGASLTATSVGGYVPAVGGTFTILDNVSASTTTGSFSGKPEGTLVAIGGVNNTLTYAGGTGNDVVFTTTTGFAPTLGVPVTYSAVIGGSAPVTITGGGTLVLSGANTYTGNTQVQSGTVSVNSVAPNSAPQPLGQSTDVHLGVAGTSSGTLLYTGGAANLPKNVFALGNGSDTIQNSGSGLLTLSGTLTKTGTVLTLRGGPSGIRVTGSITGNTGSPNSDLIIDGGTTTLASANTYNGPTYIINGGILNADAVDALPTNPARSAILMDQSGTGSSTLALGVSQSVLSLTGAATSSLNLNANSLTVGDTSGSTTFAGIISGTGGSLVKDGASTLVLSGTNTYTGGTNVTAGSIVLGNQNGFGTGTVTLAGGVNFSTSGFEGNTVAGALPNAFVLSGGMVNVDVSFFGHNDVWINTGVSGTGGFSVTSSGGTMRTPGLMLSGAKTFQGGVTVGDNARVTIDNNTSLGTGGLRADGGTDTLRVAGNVSNVANSVVIASGATLSVEVDSGIGALLSGVISSEGAGGSLTKSDTGTLTLTGANSYTGATTVSAGVLNIQNATALGTTAAGTSVASGAALEMQGGITVGNESLTLNGTGVSAAGAMRSISGTNVYGGVVTLGSDTRINTDSGALLLTNAGTITGAGFGLTVGGSSNTVISSIIGTGTGGLTKDGNGLLALTGANTYTGTTSISAGILTIGNFTTTGSLSTSSAIVNNATLLFARTNLLTQGTDFANVISGSGVVIQGSGGTTILSGANTYTGATTVSEGVLNIQNANALGTTAAGTTVNSGAALQIQGDITTAAEALTVNGTGVSNDGAMRNISGNNNYAGLVTLGAATRINSDAGTLTLGNSGTITGSGLDLTVGGVGDTTINSIIGTGTGTLTKDGAGTLSLTGANTYTGTTTISAGSLSIGNGGTTGALATGSAIVNNATLVFNRSNTLTQGTDFATVISGSGAVTQAGAGTTVLNGTNTYTGLTTVSTGVLNIRSAGALGTTAGGVTVSAGATLQIQGGISVGAEPLTLNGTGVGDNGALQNVSGINFYGGLVTLGSNTRINSGNGTYLGLTNPGIITGAGFDLTLGGVNASIEIRSVIGTGSGKLTVDGSGQFSLSGANTYTGTTTISSGTLALGFATTTGSLSPSSAIVNNAALAFNRTNLMTQGTDFASVISGSGLVVQGRVGGTTILNGANTYAGLTNVIAGTLNIQNADALGTTAAGTSVSSGAALQIQGGITTGAEALTLNGTGISTDGALRNISGTNNYAGLVTLGSATRINSDSGTLTLSNSGTITGSGLGLTVGGAGSTQIASVIGTGTGTLTKDGAGTLTLSGANTYTGSTTVSLGTLQIGNGGTTGALSSSSAITNNSALVFNRSNTVTQGTDFATVISGSGAVQKSGSGTLILSGANTYTGATTVSTGVLNIQNASALGTTAGGTSVASGAALQIQGSITTGAEALTLNGTGISSDGALRNISGTNTYAGLVTLGSATRINSDAGTLTLSNAGSITGATFDLTVGGAGDTTINSRILTTSGSLTKDGAGTLTLTGLNAYTGAMTVSVGVLNIQNGNALGTTAAGTSVSSGAALQIQGGIGVGFEALTLNGTGINNDGALRNIGGNSYAGLITLGSATRINSDASTLSLSNPGTITGATYGLTVGGVGNTVIGGIIGTGTGSLTKDGSGGLTLTGANTYTGTTTISAGSLNIGIGGTTGSLSPSSAIVNNANLAFVRSNTLVQGTDFANVISGSGAVQQFGSGTTILNGTNTFAGLTTVSGSGVLNIQSADALGTTAVGTTVFSGAALQIQGGITTAAEALTLRGTGVSNDGALRNITNSNTYAGLVTLGSNTRINSDAGTLTLSNTGTITGATFGMSVGGAGNTTINSIIGTTSGTLTKDGAGTLTLTGANTYTGNTTLSAGTLQLTQANASSAYIFNGGALQYNFGAVNFNTGGNLTFNADATISNLGQQVNFVGTVNGNNHVLTIDNGSNANPLYFNGSFGSALSQVNIVNGIAGEDSNGGIPLRDASIVISSGAAFTTFHDITINNNFTLNGGAGPNGNGVLQNEGGGTVVYSGTINLNSGSSSIGTGGGNMSMTNGVSGGGSLTKIGANTLTLSGASTYTGTTTVSGGILNIQNATGLGTTAAGTSVRNGATLQMQGNITVGAEALSLNGGAASGQTGALVNVSGTNTYGGAITVASSSSLSAASGSVLNLTGGVIKDGTVATFNGGGTINVSTVAISGASANSDLVIDGTTVNLNVANTYNGPTFIRNSGTLNANVAGALPTATRTALTFDGTGTSVLTLGAAQSVASLTSAGAATITLNTHTLTVGDASGTTTFAGAIGGTGGLTKDSASIQILSASNGYSGTTTVSAGTLSITGDINSSATLSISGGLLSTSGADKLANTAAVTVSGGTLTIGGNDTVGTLSMSSGTIGGSATLTAATYDLSGGTVNGNLGAGTLTSSGNVALNGTAGAFIVNITGGTLTLGNAERLSDTAAVTVSGGTLAIGAFDETVASVQLSSGSITGSGTLTSTSTYDVRSGSVSAVLGGTVGLTKSTGGTVTLSNSNTYTGTTTVNGGTLALSGAGQISDSSSLVVSGGIFAIGTVSDTVAGVQLTSGSITGSGGVLTSSSTYDMQNGSVSAILGGSVGLTKTTAGAVTLSGINTYTGATLLSAGDLTVNGSIGSSSLTTINGGTLMGTGTVGAIQLNSGGAINPGGASTAGTLSTGNISIVDGQLHFNIGGTGSYDQISSTGAINLAAGGTGAKLVLDAILGYNATLNNAFTLVSNDLTDAITGTFAKGTFGGTKVITLSGVDYVENVLGSNYYGRINYSGSSSAPGTLATPGNDIILKIVTPEITVTESGNDQTDGGTYDYGSVDKLMPPEPVTKTFTIKNDGEVDLMGILVHAPTGPAAADYTLDTTGTATTLIPGASTTFTLTFSPSRIGTRNAAIVIDSNDLNENPFNLAITGIGSIARDVLDGWIYTYSGPTAPATPRNGLATAVAVQKSTTRDEAVAVFATGHTTNASGNTDIYTAKYEPVTGALLWAKTYNGTANGTDDANAIVVDGNGDVLITGYVTNGFANADVFVAKYAGSDGTLLWQKIYSGPGQAADMGTSIAVDASGNVAVAGYGKNIGVDFFAAKYSSDGNTTYFERLIDGGSYYYVDQATSVAIDASGNVALAGYSKTSNNSNKDFRVMKLASADGTTLWSWNKDGTTSNDDQAYSVAFTAAGEVVAAGTVHSATYDMFTVKLTSGGSPVWQKQWDSPYGSSDAAFDMAVTSAGDVVVGGASYTSASVQDGYVAKYNGSTGALIWDRRFNGPAGLQDSLTSLDLDALDNVVVTGYSENASQTYDVLTAKMLAADGGLLWERRYNGAADKHDYGYAVAISPDGNIFVGGYATAAGDTTDFLVKNYQALKPVTQAAQTITFANPGTQSAGTPLTLSATASSGLTVRFSVVGGPAQIDDSANTLVKFTGSGSVTIRASQSGSSTFAAATSVTQTFTVNPSSQTISFTLPATLNSTAQWPLTGVASSGLAVTYSVQSGPGSIAGGILTFSGTGAVVVRASQAGDSMYNAATDVDATVTSVNHAPITIFDSITENWRDRYAGTGAGVGNDIALQLSGNDAIAGIVAGYTTGTTGGTANKDIYLAKYQSDGTKVWTYIQAVAGDDEAMAVKVDASGDVYIAGYIAGTGQDLYVAKHSGSDGHRMWFYSINGAGNGNDVGVSLDLEGTTNVVVGGYTFGTSTSNDFFAAKLAQVDGSEVWTSTQNRTTTTSDIPAEVVVGTDGSVALGGISGSDAWTVKLAAVGGAKVWGVVYNFAGKPDAVRGIGMDAANNVIIAAYSQGANYDMYTAKYAALDGTLIWGKRYNSSFNSSDAPWDMVVDEDANVYVTGTSYRSASVRDGMTLKYAGLDGTLMWEGRYNGSSGGNDENTSISLDGIGNPVIGGYTTNADSTTDVYLAKHNKGVGDIRWQRTFDGDNNKNDSIKKVKVDPNGVVWMTGSATTSGGVLEILVLRDIPSP
ncbi:autotransporter-associated beta strand repeat-containing protein [Prosthecobacter sp.]|uniref:autotransporter-associated beta strand repeat-containing protein n=1 Tax=Prosthecobacter sp. TaxID=1965333 RepID=UPI0037842E87